MLSTSVSVDSTLIVEFTIGDDNVTKSLTLFSAAVVSSFVVPANGLVVRVTKFENLSLLKEFVVLECSVPEEDILKVLLRVGFVLCVFGVVVFCLSVVNLLGVGFFETPKIFTEIYKNELNI